MALRDGLLGWLRELGQEVNDTALEAALEAADEGLKTMQQTIDTTPSDLSSVPKSNRNWTFHMRDRMSNDVDKKGNTVTASFGWKNVKNDENYFGVQEYGGSVQGKPVRAMSSLVFGKGAAENAIEKALRKKGYK